jgi:hypothetical protein
MRQTWVLEVSLTRRECDDYALMPQRRRPAQHDFRYTVHESLDCQYLGIYMECIDN